MAMERSSRGRRALDPATSSSASEAQPFGDRVQRLTVLSVLVLIMVWLGSVLGHLLEGQAAVSVSWATIGIAALVFGAVRKVPGLGAVGLTVLGITVGKLLTVDLREVDTLWRAGLFFVVGVGILRLGFLLPALTGTKDHGRRLVDVGRRD
jgi:uncharacterized membrane protein